MTPNEIFGRINAYVENKREEAEHSIKIADITAWYTGAYVRSAIGCAFDKNCVYPSEPYSEQGERERRQKELQNSPENIILRLKIAQANERINKGRKNNGEH